MYLDLPDRQRLVNLKKVYFLCAKFPRLAPALVWLTKIQRPTALHAAVRIALHVLHLQI
jgi:hypothetical protein